MVLRPYGHPLELVFPLLLAPFFVLHYGAFCWGHGTFVMALFGPESLGRLGLVDAVLQVLASPTMLLALAALATVQGLDWVRDVREKGLGAHNVKDLMVSPYRRIVVLHVTIMAGGFALAALDEPTVGLLLLVVVKTLSDVWHWRQDGAESTGSEFSFRPELLDEMREKYPEPMVTVNGEERCFESFAALKDSREFRLAQALMRLIGASEELKAMDAYMDQRITDERGQTRPETPAAASSVAVAVADGASVAGGTTR
jgi:hypothetical protein